MKMDVKDVQKYPKFSRYVKFDFPRLTNVNTIINSIKRFSGATSKPTIKKSLLWGSGPKIKIVSSLMCGTQVSYGCYRVWGGNEIEIDEALVKAFESGADLRKTKSGKLVHVAGVTLLHELTHWADAMDGIDNPVPGDPLNEEGNAFEMAVYGQVIVL